MLNTQNLQCGLAVTVQDQYAHHFNILTTVSGFCSVTNLTAYLIAYLKMEVSIPSSSALHRAEARLLLTSGLLIGQFWFLETLAVAESTRVNYIARILFFIEWCQLNQANWVDVV